MRRLTDDERDLVARHVEVARVVAFRHPHRGLLDDDERLSVAYYGLCEAAVGWQGGDFAAFAYYRAASRIMDEARRSRRWRRPWRLSRETSYDPRPALEDTDLARALRGRFGVLSPRQREVLERHMAGESWSEIARALGCHEATVRTHRDCAARRLRGAGVPR